MLGLGVGSPEVDVAEDGVDVHDDDAKEGGHHDGAAVLRDGLEDVLQVLGLGTHVEQVEGEPDVGEMWARCGRDIWKILGRYRRDVGEI